MDLEGQKLIDVGDGLVIDTREIVVIGKKKNDSHYIVSLKSEETLKITESQFEKLKSVLVRKY